MTYAKSSGPSLLPSAAALLLFAVVACQHRTSPGPVPAGVTVSGRVLEGNGSGGLNGVAVEVYADNVEHARPLASGTSNAGGYFSITSVAPGTYLLRAVKPGFVESNQQVQVARGSMPSLAIRLFPGSGACATSSTAHAAFGRCP